ncbi:MAG: elongation factor G, partial [Acholeplasmataceae bacterium]|nr:elongation factor G [Acholeplasmataceae bacterium]
MKEYNTKEIRNIALLGHQGSGKTSLSEAFLFASNAIEKKGEVEKKNTVSDYLIEEQNKLSSLSMSLIPLEWNDHKINVLDVPGSDEFVGDINQSLAVVKGAVLVVDGSKGVEVGTERIWKVLKEKNVPTMIFVNKMDKENIKIDDVLNEIRSKLGKQTLPFTWPIGKDEDFAGFVNVIEMKAHIFEGLDSHVEEIWDDKKAKADELRELVLESVAETSEELLELYFSGEEISVEQIKTALRGGVIRGDLTPILVGSATKNIGVRTLMDMMVDYFPSPADLEKIKATDPKTGDDVMVQTSDDEPFAGYVFKTTVDPFMGAISFVKVNAGTLRQGQEFSITNNGENKKAANLFQLRGKNQIQVDVFHAGDIAAIAKIDGLETGDTIADHKHPVVFDPVVLPTPVIYIAAHPKNKNDEDKISQALQRLNLEDPSFVILRNKETAQLLLGGQGMTHLGYILERMKTMFKVDVDIEDQKIVYRETIRKTVNAEGKHKKQSGGAGQFGHVWIKFEPTTELF